MKTVTTLRPLDKKLVLMGMSCVGKTTFSVHLESRNYKRYSFDDQFPYRKGVPGLSLRKTLTSIINRCDRPRFVLDNWSTEDPFGEILYGACPDACICLIYDGYQNILSRYRVDVIGSDAHYSMYKKMYIDIPFERYNRVRYFRAGNGGFIETTMEEYRRFCSASSDRNPIGTFDHDTRTWRV